MDVSELINIATALLTERDYLGKTAYRHQIMARDSTRAAAKFSEYANRLKEENDRLKAEKIMDAIDPEVLLTIRQKFQDNSLSERVREMDDELKNISIPIYGNEISSEDPMSNPTTTKSYTDSPDSKVSSPDYSPTTSLPFSSSSSSDTSDPSDSKTKQYNWSGTDSTVKPRKNRKQPK